MIGFLILNWKPSKLFMGDTGSQFLGALLAFYGIQYYWNQPTGSGEIIFSRNFQLPVLAFLMPIMDTTFVTIARMRRGQSPFVGGKDHITHHLFYFGVHEKMIPVVTLSVTLLSGILNFTILKVIGNSWSHVETFLFGGYIALMFGIFLYIYQTGLKMNKERTARLKTDEAQRQEILKVVQPEKAKILEKVIG
jgi:UDP-GlcNAc:undecaprenyl-phosphate GlcNAc-1-phosphate transferase